MISVKILDICLRLKMCNTEENSLLTKSEAAILMSMLLIRNLSKHFPDRVKHGESLRTDFAEKSGDVFISKPVKDFHWSDIKCLQIMNVLEIEVQEDRYVTDTRVKQNGQRGERGVRESKEQELVWPITNCVTCTNIVSCYQSGI